MDVLNVKCSVGFPRERKRKTQQLSAPVWHDATLDAIRIKKIEPLAVCAAVRASVITASIQNTLNFYKLLRCFEMVAPRVIFQLFILCVSVSLHLCIIDWTQLDQKRSVVTFSSGNVFPGDVTNENENARESHAGSGPRNTLIVHPGKAKPGDTNPIQPETTRSPRVLTPPPLTTPAPTLGNIFDSDGCIFAVETPTVSSSPINAASSMSSSTTPTPAILIDQRAPLRPTTIRTTTTTTAKPTITTRKSASSNLGCPKPNGLFPFDGDCSKFINCWKGRPHLQSCAGGTLFNPATNECDHAYKVVCQVARSASVTFPPTTTRPPTPPPTVSTTTTPTPVITLSCPHPKGFFPHPTDCKKFVNCWGGRPAVQVCAEGTLFNAAARECDHASKVVCLTTSRAIQVQPRGNNAVGSFFSDNVPRSSGSLPPAGNALPQSPKVDLGPPLSPDSGQLMRLRGGAGPWEGYVEVRGGKDRPWGHVCDAPDSWTIQEASVICRHLGFLRGAQKSVQGLEFGPLTRDKILIEKVECTGSEANITGCKIATGSNCPFIHEQVVGVRCHRDTQALCAKDEHAHGNFCYKLISDEMSTRERARSLCEKSGGNLLYIHSQVENDFISELLNSVAPSITKVHTDGMAIRALRKDLLVWEQMETTMNFTKWWPEWDRSKTGNPAAKSTPQCVILVKRFQYRNRCATLPYFFWTLGECDVAAAAICKKSSRDIGCVVGNGADYQGTANISKTGMPCLGWNDPRIRHVLAKPARAAVAVLDSAAAKSSLTVNAGLRHNFCRNPHGESNPWCFISPVEMEYCDIPKCNIQERGAVLENKCKANQYKCNTGECIPNTWVCDGATDCEGGSDEDLCAQYMNDFYKRQNETIQLHDVEKWMNTNLDTCARRCAEAKSFTCLSFNHNEGQSECVLSDSNRGLSGQMVHSPGWTYYERKVYSVNCSSNFECPSGKCINQTSVCDGRDDCGDRSDEIVCQSQLDFQIRLVGSNKTNEGRVEVKVFGQWGAICDDHFSANDANVICRQLGFPLGASQALSHSTFGPGSPILMDDVMCRGNETSLADCPFAGWGVHNCAPEETAGVRCILAETTCTENQFKCETTDACIAIDFLCDTVDDCGDHSDENRTRCASELLVRLADGPDSLSGRVELRQNGIWGTVCDDDFGPEEATVICRMLNLNGPAQPAKSGSFGPGKGPIWLDELGCSGTENTLMECARLPWAKHNCRHTEDAGVRCSHPTNERKLPEDVTETNPVSTLTDLVQLGSLPVKCGIRMVEDNPSDPLLIQPKVVKGEPTKPGAYPWQVGVRVRNSGKSDNHWCGATIISEHFILTAAHCMEDFPKGLYVLRVGDYNTEDTDVEEEQFTVERMHFHEEFGQGGHLNNDIALIRIKKKGNQGIRFGSHVQPICLPSPSTEYVAGMNCTIAGWGSPGQPGAAFAIKLQSATVPILSDDTCKAPYVYGPDRIKVGMFCAGLLEGGVDACQGDSGGGLVCLVDGRPTLMGVISWGFGCGRPNRPGVYTRVVHYLPWIYSKLAETNA